MDMITEHGKVDAIQWTRDTLAEALKFASVETARVETVRAYHLARAVETGRCAIGHTWAVEDAYNHRGLPCGYCENARRAAS